MQKFTPVRHDIANVLCMQRSIKAGYQLADNYADLFKADNGENPDTKKEIIYPIIFDGDKTQSWGMAAIIIRARGAEDKDVLLAHSGVDQGWAGFRSNKQSGSSL